MRDKILPVLFYSWICWSEMEVVLRFENICSSRRFLKPLLISQCFMWFGSHFTVGVTRRLLLSSRVSLLVINLLTIRERVIEKRQGMKLIWGPIYFQAVLKFEKFDRTLRSHGTVQYFRFVHTVLWTARRLNFRTVRVVPCEPRDT